MAAGLGFKTFATGDVLTAADTNGYLMQGVLVFASSAARTSALPAPDEGQISFLKDTNSTEYYSGSAWVAVGAVAASGLTLLSSTSVSGAASYSVNSVFTGTYTNYKVIVKTSAATNANDDMAIKLRASGTDSSAGLYSQRVFGYGSNVGAGEATANASNWLLGLFGSGNPAVNTYSLDIFDPQSATKTSFTNLAVGRNGSVFQVNYIAGYADNNTQYDGFTIFATGNFSASIKVYGYGN